MTANSLPRRLLSAAPGLKRAIREARRILAGEPRILPGSLEMPELAALIGRSDPLILEIGANDGTSTLALLETFDGARVYSFEPDPRARKRFTERVRDPRVHLLDFAIGNIDGVTTFFASGGTPPPDWQMNMPGGWDLSGSIRKPKEHLQLHPWCKFEQSFEVPVRKLDTWSHAEGIGPIDLIWADVQGAESDLIQGGVQTLRRTRFLYTEYSDRELYDGQIDLRRLRRLLPGFSVVRRYAGDVLLQNRQF